MTKPQNFAFAAKTNAIPLLPHEFPMAAASYPIVFAGTDHPMPAMAVGLRVEENLFVDQAGKWAEGAYIPAYVTRYPFILMEDPANKQFIFCIDEKSQMLGKTEGIPLFNGDKLSDFTQNAMKFCADLHQQGEGAMAFMEALKEQKLLVRQDFKANLGGETMLHLTGLWAVDPQKFDLLPDNVFLDWRHKGWIALIYAHLLSSHRWPALVGMTAERMKKSNSGE